MTARALAVLGTGSDVGKSLIAAGICRLLSRTGVRVAPFKAQNMSLNSYVTPDGGEIGRAQALQADACGLAPHVDMNPILLKPESDTCSQVVVRGKVFAKQDASTYFDGRRRLWSIVEESYARLASQYDVMVIEGAGSAAEINLRERDLVNWPIVTLADAQVLLVADIDRGGVFAQVIGTLDLLEPEERAEIRGIVINKFRGDATLFADGVRFLASRTGIPLWRWCHFSVTWCLIRKIALIEAVFHTHVLSPTASMSPSSCCPI
ncbi:MAG: cobyric acid synthase [Nitrospira sp.]